MQIREEVVGIKTGARKDLDRFVDDIIRQLPNVIESAKAQDLKQFLPAFLEDAFKQWAEEETKEIAIKLEQLAEKTIALVREDARDNARRVAAVLGNDAKRLDVQVDTIKYDIGVVALMFGGVALMAINLMAGGVLAVAGPAIFAMFARGKIHEEFKKRANELAPEVMRETAKKVAPKLDEMIDDFAQKLDAWVVSAGRGAAPRGRRGPARGEGRARGGPAGRRQDRGRGRGPGRGAGEGGREHREAAERALGAAGPHARRRGDPDGLTAGLTARGILELLAASAGARVVAARAFAAA